MNNCEYEKDKHCTLNECMYADLRDKPGYPICSMLTTAEKIAVDMHDKYSEKELITYYGKKNGEPYRIELEAENLDLAEHDAKIRIDAIDKCINTIKSNWAFWNVGVIASVIKTLEKLKEQEMSEKELRKEIEKLNKEYDSCSCHIGEDQSDGTEHDYDYCDHCIGCEYFYKRSRND